MRKFWMVLLVVILGLAAGLGAGYGVSLLIRDRNASLVDTAGSNWRIAPQWQKGAAPYVSPDEDDDGGITGWQKRGYCLPPGQQKKMGDRMLPRIGNNGERGRWMMRVPQTENDSAQKMTAEQVIQMAQSIVADEDNLKIGKVMEFERGFYVEILEKDTGRGAYELLVGGYGRRVGRSMPMMWNLKYGPRASGSAVDNTVSQSDAQTAAQALLDGQSDGCTIQSGTSFYGYYTFVYACDGQTTGLVRMNGLTGTVRLHEEFGKFISMVEVTQ